jgi:hypothetical protein
VDPNCFEKSESSGGHHVGGVVRILEGDADVGLGAQVVHLVRADGVHLLA